jgi:hypothetical protein
MVDLLVYTNHRIGDMYYNKQYGYRRAYRDRDKENCYTRHAKATKEEEAYRRLISGITRF